MTDLSKVFFITDMDGTLLPHTKILNPADIAAIEKLCAAGGHFSIATGRALQSAEGFFPELPLDGPVILYNGGAVYDCKTKKFAWQKLLAPSAMDIVRAVYDEFPHMAIEVNCSDNIYILRSNEREEKHIEIAYGGRAVRTDLESFDREDRCKVLFADEEDTIPPLMDYILSMNNGEHEYVRSSPNFFEILPNDCTKGSALDIINRLYPEDGRYIVACGDFNNDVEMLRRADFAVSPANAESCAKEVSDLITKADCNNGAVAEAIEYVMNTLLP